MDYFVTNSNDFGTGSLREALELANANSGKDKIVIKVDNINLDSALNITDAVEIQGRGVVITQQGNDRLFTIDDGTDAQIKVKFNGLNLTGGQADLGGAIYNKENFRINRSSIFDNVATKRGGAIYTEGNLLVKNSEIADNIVIPEGLAAAGGGIYARFGGSLRLANSVVRNNEAIVGGGIIAADSSTAVITDSQITDNLGEGIVAVVDSHLEISNSTISGNQTDASGGGVVVQEDSSAVITDSQITDNHAIYGGGLAAINFSSLDITNSTVSGNTAEEDGGGIDLYNNSQLNLVDSTVTGNSALYDNNIANYDGTSEILLTDSDIQDQQAMIAAEYNGEPIRIEAEDADRFIEHSPEDNFGGQYRWDGGLDVQKSGDGGYNVGWIDVGESLEYDVDIAESGTYDVLLRIGTRVSEAREIEVSIDDISVGTVSFGSTGGWQSYTDVVIEDVSFNAGTSEIQLDALSSHFNVDYIELF